MSENIDVLICDDSALMRNLVGRIIDEADGLEVVAKAMNGRFALQKIEKTNPDLIILDLEMPEMNGIEFLKERKRLGIEVPVVILSSIAKRGAKVTMEALALGASDFILKPSGAISQDIAKIGEHIVKTVKAYGLNYKRKKKPLPDSIKNIPSPLVSVRQTFSRPAPLELSPTEIPTGSYNGQIELVVIGISTGGPNALRSIFAEIDPKLKVPVVIVQHMPAGFTEEFANSLDRICPLSVKEASDGDLLKPGRVLIAPGSHHIVVEKKKLASIVRILDTDTENGHRPSADVLFRSVHKEYGKNALAVIMTGMGRDGAKEITNIHNAGGLTVAQNEESCIVFGMPRVAIENKGIQKIVHLKDMAKTISDLVCQYG